MIRNLSILLIFIFAFSCSIFEQNLSVDKGRKISSLPMDEVIAVEDDETIQVKGSVRVYGKRNGYNSFRFPLLNLESPFYEDIPYKVVVTNENVFCSHSNNIKKIGKKNTFEVRRYVYGDFLRCSYTSEGEGFFNFEYILPKIKTFAVSEAEYMKGFTPDIVSNMELTLAKIYEKLVPKNGKKPERLYYRDRELLLKYVPDIINITFDPRKFEVQFKTQIGKQDLFLIHKINGILTQPKWGEFSYEGYENDDYLNYGGAGSKYLRSHGIKPFGLYCRHENEDYNFESINKLTIADKGNIECSINSRKSRFLGFRAPKGEVKAEIQIMRVSKAIKNLPKYFLNKAQKAITNKILQMNKKNFQTFNRTIKKAIDKHEEEIVDMLTVDQKFPFNIIVRAKILKRIIFNKPMIRYETKAGKELKYLSYGVFYKNVYEDKNQAQFQSSDIYMGELKTNMIIPKGKKLSSYSFFTSVNNYDFENTLRGFLEKYSTGEEVAVYNSYKNMLKKYSKNQKYSPQKSLEIDIHLSRFGLNLCGTIFPKVQNDGSQNENMMLTVVRARYDLFEGGNSGAFRSMYTDNFYYKEFELEKPIEISTPMTYTDSSLTKDKCYHISPSEFASGSYENSVILKNI